MFLGARSDISLGAPLVGVSDDTLDRTYRALADRDQMNFVPSTIAVPNRCNIGPPVQIPDDCASVLGPAHNNRPRSAGSDTSHRFLVSAHDVGDRNTERYSVAAYQLPESNSVIVAPRCHIFTVRECDAVARNGLDDLNHLGCLCQQGLKQNLRKANLSIDDDPDFI